MIKSKDKFEYCDNWYVVSRDITIEDIILLDKHNVCKIKHLGRFTEFTDTIINDWIIQNDKLSPVLERFLSANNQVLDWLIKFNFINLSYKPKIAHVKRGNIFIDKNLEQWILALIGKNELVLVNLDKGWTHDGSKTIVKNWKEITFKEFSEICKGKPENFTLIRK